MEKLKTARKPIRALLTRTCNEINDLLYAEEFDEIQITGKDGKLDELLVKIQVFDQQILDLYLEAIDEQGYEDEILAIDKYSSDVRIAKIKINRAFQKRVVHVQHPPSEYSSVTSNEYKQKRKFKLPKIELKKFSGKLIDWLSWWSQFEKIHSDDELHTTDKCEYLRQAMETNTRAKDIVDGYPATEDNYLKVINSLKERFGKKKLLIQVYVRELFQMGLKNLNKEVELVSMFDKLVSHVRALESLGITTDQSTMFLYPMVESSLPIDTLVAWQRSPGYEKDGSSENPPKNEMDYLFQFLEQEVEHKMQRQLVNEFESKQSNRNNLKTKNYDVHETNGTTAASLFNGQNRNCVFCEKTHDSKDCGGTEHWSMTDMKNCMQKKGACFQCLKTNHLAKDCKSFVKCHVCSGKHHTVICPDIKKELEE